MNEETENLPHCGLFRRLAAILYDTLLLIAVLIVAAALWLPFAPHVAPGQPPQAVYGNDPVYKALFTSYLLMVAFFFFGGFWTYGGQTLGMRAWRLRVQTRAGTAISLWQALLRFLVAFVSWAAVGLGFLWSLVDREKMTWHDRYSESVLVVVPKKGRGE